MFHCREQTITKISSAMVAPFFGTVFLVTLREARVPLVIQTLRKEQ